MDIISWETSENTVHAGKQDIILDIKESTIQHAISLVWKEDERTLNLKSEDLGLIPNSHIHYHVIYRKYFKVSECLVFIIKVRMTTQEVVVGK
jgi:hypothetical protein